MRLILFILLLNSFIFKAQDKLFFVNGTSKTGIIISNARDFVYFRATDTSAVQKISKDQLILMEDHKGNRYLYAGKTKQKNNGKTISKDNTTQPRNSISIQPTAFFFGRLNLSYERLSRDNRIGFVIPVILTFDPSFGNAFYGIDSTRARIKGIKYITGIDINFYSEKGNTAKLFIGPRIRYGTDVAFYNTEGYSIQTQAGIKLSKPSGKIVQHFSIGFGFVRVLSSSLSPLSDRKQAYPWYSVNYRLGVKW